MDTQASLWDRLGAWIYDPFLWLGERRGMARRRHDLLADAEGRVLEIGAGTGLNLRHYGEPVEALVLTEPVEPMARALERPWAAFAFGCHCNRPTLELLATSPLTIDQSEFANWHGMPPLVRPLTIGSAVA